ncbi:MAG TPA: MOSC domain-containing protein [Thermomicrobiales bacterium]|jgi:MOSC domain-containing protein YiiM
MESLIESAQERATGGRVVGIFTAPAAGVSMVALERAEVVAGRGLVGDRYFTGDGYYSQVPPLTGRRLTLIASEALAALAEETGIVLRADECRRNLVTQGVDLDALIGKRFRVGAIECYGERPCPPCGYLEKLTGLRGVNRGLTDRGGIRAEILLDGEIAVGDVVDFSTIVP